MKLISLFVLVFFVVGMMACGGGPKPPIEGTPEATIANIPDWFSSPPQDPNYLYAAATEQSRNLQLAIDEAKTRSRGDLASQYEVKVEAMNKSFTEEVGLDEDTELLSQYTQVIKEITSTVLNGTRVKEQKVIPDGDIYRAFVLMELPIGEANIALMQKIRDNQNMYTRFRASQSFQELEEEVEKYEQYKKDQGMIK